MTLYEGTKVIEIEKSAQGIVITLEQNGRQQQINGSHLLVATGRQANVRDLNLEVAQVNFTNKAFR